MKSAAKPSEKTLVNPVKKPALGRGLSVLLAQAEATYATGGQGGAVRRIALNQLVPGKYQPRQRFDGETISQLAESIKARGVLQPLLVRQVEGGKFEIIAGERRWRAAKQAGIADVPVLVQPFSDSEVLEIGLIENLQREDLNALEEAEAYQRLMQEFGHSQQAMADTIGKSRSHVANTLRLLALPEGVRTMLVTGRLTAGHARALLSAANPLQLAEQIVARGLSVRETERLATLVSSNKNKPSKPKRSVDVATIEADLSQRLGMRTQVVANGDSGRLTLHFRTLEQFDDLLARLTRAI